MIVVSDTSPITNLVGVRRLEILRVLFGEVVIPAKVHEELLAGPDGAAVLDNVPWIRVEVLRDRQLAAQLESELDAGEAEAIGLAVQLRAELLLIDERRGSAAAERQGLKPMGLVGVLLEAGGALSMPYVPYSMNSSRIWVSIFTEPFLSTRGQSGWRGHLTVRIQDPEPVAIRANHRTAFAIVLSVVPRCRAITARLSPRRRRRTASGARRW